MPAEAHGHLPIRPSRAAAGPAGYAGCPLLPPQLPPDLAVAVDPAQLARLALLAPLSLLLLLALQEWLHPAVALSLLAGHQEQPSPPQVPADQEGHEPGEQPADRSSAARVDVC